MWLKVNHLYKSLEMEMPFFDLYQNIRHSFLMAALGVSNCLN